MSSPNPLGQQRAILHPKAAERAIDVGRHEPRESLAPYVDYHWLVRWDLAEPHEQQVVPQPRVHLAAEDGRLLVHGISRDPFVRTLHARGHVLGAAFKPGGFRPVLGTSVGSLMDSVRPAGDLFDEDDRLAAAAILDPDASDTDIIATFEDYLERLEPLPDPLAEEVAAWVAEAEHDLALTRADALAARAGVSLRTLQRLFTEYVGIGPKWVIQRFRILDAAAAAHGSGTPDWAEVAVRLGFSDQAHLTRVFTQVVGAPPATYVRGEGV